MSAPLGPNEATKNERALVERALDVLKNETDETHRAFCEAGAAVIEERRTLARYRLALQQVSK